MHAINKKDVPSLIEKVAVFAGREIAARPDMNDTDDFPLDIWKKMAHEGLLRLGIPARYGGTKIAYDTLVLVGESLVRHGHNMGLALSWIIHLLASGFMIGKFGTPSQRIEYLPKMADGIITASIAFSELRTGADPRRLSTTAHREGDHFILNGEKAYLTNGPLADFFVVYAVTGMAEGKKQFTAFLVSRENRNLTITEVMKLDFLRPSPHCLIRLENCSVPASAILGREGMVLEEMARPCRTLEDALLNGPILGGMCRQMELVLNALRKRGATPTDDVMKGLGEMEMWRQTLRWMACEAAKRMKKEGAKNEYETLLMSFRRIAADCQSLAGQVIETSGIGIDGELAAMTKDIRSTLDLLRGGDPSRQKKIGKKIIGRKESNEHIRP
ncbi:MAG: acyl-CoA dehydrogenase family protein [Syntrophales bacterium]|jgi:alkylation response protein AidB-like acyl-CoA dehydrogenase